MHNIRNKYLLRMTLFIVLTIGGLIILYSSLAEDLYIAEHKKKMDELYRTIEQMNLNELSGKEMDRLDEYSEQGFHCMVVGNKKIVYSTYNRIEDRKAVRKRINRNPDQYTENAKVVMGVYGKSMKLKGLIHKEDMDYYVFINIKLRTLKGSVDFMTNIMIIGLFVILGISIPFSFYMADRTIKPIERISIMTKRMGQNHYTEKDGYVFENDEIGELAANVREMYGKITNSVNEMNNYNYLLQMQNRDLIKFEERRTEFINKATHELKTPLAIVSSQIEMINIDNAEIMSEYYDSIMEEIKKMSDLIRDMLKNSFDEPSVDAKKLKRESLSELLEGLKGKYSVWLDTKNIHASFDVEKDVFINMDRQLVEQAINNYVINAYEHTGEKGIVRISLKVFEGKAVLSVYNEGELIPEDKLKDIWNKFNSDKKNNESSNVGLGLYIVADIVKYHRGSCYVANRSGGVEFYMDFDLA